MSYASVREMLNACKANGKPLYEVILESDLAESGLSRAASEAEMRRLWAVMCQTSADYRACDRSMSGFAGGDAAKMEAAAAGGVLLHETHCGGAHSGQLRGAARGAAAAVPGRSL